MYLLAVEFAKLLVYLLAVEFAKLLVYPAPAPPVFLVDLVGLEHPALLLVPAYQESLPPLADPRDHPGSFPYPRPAARNPRSLGA